MAYATTVERHKTRRSGCRRHMVGGDNPIWVQSMTTTNTFDVEETLAQILRLEEAGCEIVRVTMPKKEDVEACKLIRDRISIPLIADIHYDYRMALACLDAITPSGKPAVDKIRINPGQHRRRRAIQRGRPQGPGQGNPDADRGEFGKPRERPDRQVRVPVPGSHGRKRSAIYRDVRAAGLQADDRQPEGQPRAHGRRLLHPVCRSERLSDPRGNHGGGLAGVWHAKECCGHRRDLAPRHRRHDPRFAAGRPGPEIAACFDILRACDRRVTKPEVVACPTCGRLDIDLERIVAEVEDKMKHLKNPLRISILGCLVNGFGEAKEADLGIAAGAGKGIIFKRGVPIRHVKEAEMVQALLEEVERFDEETQPLDSYVEKEKQKQQKLALPVLN